LLLQDRDRLSIDDKFLVLSFGCAIELGFMETHSGMWLMSMKRPLIVMISIALEL
jgi:hypothetical protein